MPFPAAEHSPVRMICGMTSPVSTRQYPESSLRALLDMPALGLHPIIGTSEQLAAPLRWVHSSDLADPTPFLADDLVLLTTGAQFAGEVDVTEYVARLTARGVLGLGFGTGVRMEAMPAELAEACERAGLPLFEVPYRTPFIAVARAHAEAIAAQAYARRTWALETQRALAAAALRPHGLSATIAELARSLDTWAVLFDAAGAPVIEHPPSSMDDMIRTALAEQVDELLARGTEAGRSVLIEGELAVQLFTLGRSRSLRGVLAIEAPLLDAETRGVVTSVIAMAGLALEQTEQLAEERRRLHSQVLTSLLTDDPALARAVLPGLPLEPFVVAVAADALPALLEEWWERQRAQRGSRTFIATGDDGVVVCLPPIDAVLLDHAAARFGIRFGVSDPSDFDGFSRAHAQALGALRRGDGRAVVRFADTAGGALAAMATEDARLIAETRLQPLREHGGDLEHVLRIWLEHDGRLEHAATALGIHRHTLRSRIAMSSRLLGMDLSSFPARAELWALLHAVG